MMFKPTVICLTPVKNEAWILEPFLKAASLWADHIIIADQNSDDGSREIAQQFPKVTLIENRSSTFNEPERQKLLLEAARQIPGPRLLLALDADEFITANFQSSAEWQRMLAAAPGTVIGFHWAVVLPDLNSYYIFPAEFPLGFVDDGSAHEGKPIHSTRVPVPAEAPMLSMQEILVLHYSVADFERFKSKVRWYQCWEYLNGQNSSFLHLYRWYHRDFCIPPSETKLIPEEWRTGYAQRGIEPNGFVREGVYRWDKEMLKLFAEHGVKRFRRLAVWDVDWRNLYEHVHGLTAPAELRDPRNWFERLTHRWLQRTQPYCSHWQLPQSRLQKLGMRGMHKVLRSSGW
jgi:hypothetical protein